MCLYPSLRKEPQRLARLSALLRSKDLNFHATGGWWGPSCGQRDRCPCLPGHPLLSTVCRLPSQS
jgi:hypothetical protein